MKNIVYTVERETKPMTPNESSQTPMRLRRNSDITNYFIHKTISSDINTYNNQIIDNIINNNSKNDNCWIVTRLKKKYNNLEPDVKELLDYTSELLRTLRNLESSLSRVKREYNELQSSLMSYKRRVKTAEDRAEQATCCLPAENICCVCMTKPRECAYIGCGHFSACSECCARMGDQCPICRTNSPFVKIIVS